MPLTMAKKTSADRHTQPRESFHLSVELRQALIDYVDSQRPAPDKSEVLRVALEEFLERRGFWPVDS